MNIEDFCKLVEQNLDQRLANVSQPLITNNCNTLEHYKLVSGMRIGLLDAVDILQQTYIQIFKPEELEKKSEGVDKNGAIQRPKYTNVSRKGKHFY